MDTTKEYIKMCDCSEIQRRWRADEFDFFVCSCHKERCNCQGGETSEIWLPRQDQLQDMIPIQHEFVLGGVYCACQKEWSLEQLWLSYVMAELYNKKWNGEEWG